MDKTDCGLVVVARTGTGERMADLVDMGMMDSVVMFGLLWL